MNQEEKVYKNERERKGIPYKKIEGIDTLGGFFPNYDMDNDGNVWNRDGKVLKHTLDKRGYHSVCLTYRCGEKVLKKNCLIHRLVAYNFLPKKLVNTQVDHLNCDKDDNSEGNVEWVDNDENMRRATANGLRPKGESCGNNKYPEALMKDIIFDLYVKKMKVPAVVAKYNIHEHTVRSVRDREYWNWLIDEVLKEHGCEDVELTRRKRHTKELMTKVILALMVDKLDNIVIARKYGLAVSTVNNVKRGASWGWLVKEITTEHLIENNIIGKSKRKKKMSELESSTTREMAPCKAAILVGLK